MSSHLCSKGGAHDNMAWGGERLRYAGGGTKDEHHFVFNCHLFEILPRSGVTQIYNLSKVAPAYLNGPLDASRRKILSTFKCFVLKIFLVGHLLAFRSNH